jgi:hypothetical protein
MYASAMGPLPPRRATAPAERLVTKREMDDAVQSARGAGLGLALLVGGYEHFKHKRREKRQEKKYQQLDRRLQQAREGYQFTAAEQSRKQDLIEYQLHAAERRLGGQPVVPQIQRTESVPFSPAQGAERLPTGRPENTPGSRVERFTAPRTEQLVQARSEQMGTNDGQFELPADQRLVREGAFIAQVEKSTGKLVENPSFEYGHEYDLEREVAAVATAMGQSHGSQGGESGNGGGGGSAGGGGTASAAGNGVGIPAPPVIPSATSQGPPSSVSVQNTTGAKRNTTEQPLWPWVVALVAVVVCLIALLH